MWTTRALIPSIVLIALLPSATAQFGQQGKPLIGVASTGAREGSSSAISADGNTAIVGGPYDSNATGAAWVFTRTAGVWDQGGAKLVGSGAAGSARQGTAVAISGDGNTVLIAGPLDNPVAVTPGIFTPTGAVWVFTRSGGAWTQQGSKLTAGGSSLAFGNSVALSADGATALIGGSGVSWAFTRTNSVWGQQGGAITGTGAVSSSPNCSTGQGNAVALSADGNTAIIGIGGDNCATGTGWVFTRSSGLWTQQGGKLVGAGSATANLGASQGASVAISGDGNTIMLGGPWDNNGRGAAWIFTRTNGVWTQQGGKLVANDFSDPGFDFDLVFQGRSVALSGDGNTAIFGGAGNIPNGAVWAFTRSGGVWSQLGSKFSGTGASDLFEQGQSLALSADGKTLIEGGDGAAWAFVNPLPVAAAASVTGVAPPAGSGPAATFTFTFSDSHDWRDLTVANVLINSAIDGRQACYLAFAPSGPNAGSLYLVDDAGHSEGPYAGLSLPGSGTVQNSQCGVSGAGSTVSGGGNTLTLTLAITFAPGFAGNKVIYMAARDAVSNSGWQGAGTWNVPGPLVSGPAVTAFNPAHSSGLGQSYTFTFSDPAGAQDVGVADVLINSAINGIGACYLALVPTGANSATVYLIDDAGHAGLVGPFNSVTLPGSGKVNNGQCSISAAGSSVSANGNTLTFVLAVTFTPSFAGNEIIYAAARSNIQNSGWQAVGTVAVK